MKGILLLLSVLFAACSAPSLDFESRPDLMRVLPVEVSPGRFDRFDKPVTVKLDLADFSGQRDSSLQLDAASLRVIELDQNGDTINDAVLFQFDPDPSRKADKCDSGVLTFLMDGTSPKGMLRRFRVQIGPAETTPFQPTDQKQVSFDSVHHAGFESFRFTTNSGSYFYHIRGSAFASMIDRDGKDWISYKPEGGAEGSYRGIPNIAPAGFHPGPGEKNKLSRILARGPLRAEIRSESEDGKWACTWEIFPSYATMTLDRKGAESYWMLYEGTPGGRFTVDDYWVDSSGKRFESGPWTSKNKWNGDLPEPEWVYFGDSELNRVLFLAHHEYSKEIDEYWHFGDGGMTVFGFGRGPREVAWQRLKRVPARLTIGFAESTDFSEVRSRVCSAYKPIEVKVGESIVIE